MVIALGEVRITHSTLAIKPVEIYICGLFCPTDIETPIYIAISFGYFESLFRSRSVDLVKREYGRFRDMATTLTEMGHEEYLYEPFLDSTLNILAEIVQGIQRGEPDETFLLDAIKAPYVSDSIVAFFRVSNPASINHS
jgi:hypothetical protein